MWFNVVSLDQIHSNSKYKSYKPVTNLVSVFEGSSYDLIAIGDLVIERKETIDTKLKPEESFNYIGLDNVAPLTGDLINYSPKLGKEILSRSKVFYEGDVLYGRLRPYLNKVFLPPVTIKEGVCSGEFFVLTPIKHIISPYFLRTMLASSYVQNYVSGWQTGSVLPRLQLSDLLGIKIPVPDLKTQQKFEEYLIAQNNYRLKLVNELSGMPEKIMSAVMTSLKTGDLSFIQKVKP